MKLFMMQIKIYKIYEIYVFKRFKRKGTNENWDADQ